MDTVAGAVKPGWVLLALLLLAGGGVAVYTQTRGLRNNNPGNIRATTIIWDGQTGIDTAAGGPFAIFQHSRWGLRALAKLLLNYERIYGINTPTGIINRWAPSHENPTDNYVQHVANAVGVAPEQAFSVREKLPQLMRAIIYFENGIQPYSEGAINEAINLV